MLMLNRFEPLAIAHNDKHSVTLIIVPGIGNADFAPEKVLPVLMREVSVLVHFFSIVLALATGIGNNFGLIIGYIDEDAFKYMHAMLFLLKSLVLLFV